MGRVIWIAIPVLAVLALAPLGLVFGRRRRARGRREAAMTLHRAQLEEVDRDLAEGRILAAEHATARLEIQRRLLLSADTADPVTNDGSRGALLITLVAVPVAALVLYLAGGQPMMPAMPLADRTASQTQQARQEDVLIDNLRNRVETLDPRTPQAHEGYVLLGEVEEARGNHAAAAKAWRQALVSGFDPTIAAEAAEATTRADGGRVDATAADLFRRALAAAPPDAPWRELAERRLGQAAPAR